MENLDSSFKISNNAVLVKWKKHNVPTKENEKPINESSDNKKQLQYTGLKTTTKSDLAKCQKDTKSPVFTPIKNSTEINNKYRLHIPGVSNIKNEPNLDSNCGNPINIVRFHHSKLNECGDKNSEKNSNLVMTSNKLPINKINKHAPEGLKQQTENTIPSQIPNETNVIYKRKRDDTILNKKSEKSIIKSSLSKSDNIKGNTDIASCISKKSINKSKSLLTKCSRRKTNTKQLHSITEPSQLNLTSDTNSKNYSVICTKKQTDLQQQLDFPQSTASKVRLDENEKSVESTSYSEDDKGNVTDCSSKLENEETNSEDQISPIQIEFLYYSKILKEIAPKLSEEKDRQKIILWLKKMFKPEYMTSVLQIKRNQYLMLMSLSALNDEVYNILSLCPPNNILPEISGLPEIDIKPAQWEIDNTWETTLELSPKDAQRMGCSAHQDTTQCLYDHKWDKLLDDEFKYLLYLSKPFTYLLKNSEDKCKMQAWILKLCKINTTNCSTMRGIRNDYMMLLLGYIQELQVVGPFKKYPTNEPLKPLKEILKSFNRKTILDPNNSETQSFLINQPVPTDGAFCYVAVTGNLVDSKTMQDIF